MTSENPKKFSFHMEEQPVPETISIPNYPAASKYPKLETLPDEKITKIKNLLTLLKWLLLPLSLMQLLFILPEAYPLLGTMLFPLMGLLGIRNKHAFWISLFGISMVLLSLAQIIVMGILKGVAYIVVQTIFILFQLFTAFICYRASRFMNSLSPQDWMNLNSD